MDTIKSAIDFIALYAVIMYDVMEEGSYLFGLFRSEERAELERDLQVKSLGFDHMDFSIEEIYPHSFGNEAFALMTNYPFEPSCFTAAFPTEEEAILNGEQCEGMEYYTSRFIIDDGLSSVFRSVREWEQANGMVKEDDGEDLPLTITNNIFFGNEPKERVDVYESSGRDKKDWSHKVKRLTTRRKAMKNRRRIVA